MEVTYKYTYILTLDDRVDRLHELLNRRKWTMCDWKKLKSIT